MPSAKWFATVSRVALLQKRSHARPHRGAAFGVGEKVALSRGYRATKNGVQSAGAVARPESAGVLVPQPGRMRRNVRSRPGYRDTADATF